MHRHFPRYIKTLTRIVIGFLFVFFLLPYGIPLGLRDLPHSSIVYDAHGQEIGEIVKDQTYRHISLTYDDFPPFLTTIVVALEDQRFWQHHGIDRIALARATKNNLQEKKIIEGGSTIEAQLIRNTYRLNKPRTLMRKAAEFYLAMMLNAHHSKKAILTQYLNTVSFGYLNYGFASAARYFFGKPLGQLTKAEMIALLSIPKNPARFDPYKHFNAFEERYQLLVNYFHDTQVIDDTEYEMIKNEKIAFVSDHQNTLPYIIDLVAKTMTGEKQTITTSIDAYMTKKIYDSAYSTIMDLLRKDVGDFGVLVIDKATGQVKVLLGGIDYHQDNGQVNSVFALNQAGSAIKPFTYALAFKELGWTPEDTIIDEPVQFTTDQGYGYTPKNYSLEFKGEVTLAEALAQSLNVPAIKIADKLGADKLLDFLRKAGITSLTKDADYYGLALTLGVGEMSLRELTRAYGVFAHSGQLCSITIFSGEQSTCTPVIEEKYVNQIVQILSNRYFKLQEFPMYGNLDFPDRFVFLKSGTSRNFADNRTLGFTDHYLIGVWVGNKDGTPMKGVCGACGAGDIFNKIVYLLEKDEYVSPAITLEANKQSYVTITSPLDKSVLKYDESFSDEVQNIKLDFSTNVSYDTVQRTINGKNFDGKFWNIIPGSYTLGLKLFDDGQEVGGDKSTIEVQK